MSEIAIEEALLKQRHHCELYFVPYEVQMTEAQTKKPQIGLTRSASLMITI